MADLLVRVIINGIALVAAIKFIPGAAFTGDIWKLALLAIVFGLVNAYLRPIVKMLSLPLNLVVFGLVGLLINIALVLVSAAISDNLHLGFTLGGWPPGAIELDTLIAAFLVAVLISVVSALVALVRKLAPGI
jgi:putative membrane protein